MTKGGKKLPVWKCLWTMTKKDACISNKLLLQNHSLTLIQKKKPLPSAIGIPSRSLMTYYSTASLDKLTCSDYVDFGKCQDRFGRFSWFMNDSNYWEVKLNVFKKDDNK